MHGNDSMSNTCSIVNGRYVINGYQHMFRDYLVINKELKYVRAKQLAHNFCFLYVNQEN